MTPPTVTEAHMVERVRYWQDRLGLSDVEIVVMFGEDKEENSEAGCSASPEYLYAVLSFDLAKIEPNEVEGYVVHELLHIPTWPLVHLAEGLAREDALHLENVRERQETLHTWLERMVLRLTNGSK